MTNFVAENNSPFVILNGICMPVSALDSAFFGVNNGASGSNATNQPNSNHIQELISELASNNAVLKNPLRITGDSLISSPNSSSGGGDASASSLNSLIETTNSSRHNNESSISSPNASTISSTKQKNKKRTFQEILEQDHHILIKSLPNDPKIYFDLYEYEPYLAMLQKKKKNQNLKKSDQQQKDK